MTKGPFAIAKELKAKLDARKQQLQDAGFVCIGTIMADDARKDGVTNFGSVWLHADGHKLYLNYKTVDDMAV